jgi:hypothetical protein
MTALALCAWLGGANRFASSRKAVRFVGLDITVHSSDGKRSPGRLSRQGPQVLRWLLFEAAKTSARSFAPAYDYYTTVRQRHDGNRAALSQARRIVRQAVHILTELGDDAFTATPAVTSTAARYPSRGCGHGPAVTPTMGYHRGQLPPVRCQTASPPARRRRGRPYETERPHSPPAGSHPIDHHVARHNASCLQAIGKPGCPPATSHRPPTPLDIRSRPPRLTTTSPKASTSSRPRRLIICPQPAASRAPPASQATAYRGP